MTITREKEHPVLGILVRDNGEVYVPSSPLIAAHWTFGWTRKDGYKAVKINKKEYLVHRLVAETYLEPVDGKPFVDHIDRIKHHNFVSNLRYVDSSENNKNTCLYDACESKWHVHPCDDRKEYMRLYNQEHTAGYYQTEAGKEARKRAYEKRKATQKNVKFSDGKYHRVSNELAAELFLLPVSERIYMKNIGVQNA